MFAARANIAANAAQAMFAAKNCMKSSGIDEIIGNLRNHRNLMNHRKSAKSSEFCRIFEIEEKYYDFMQFIGLLLNCRKMI